MKRSLVSATPTTRAVVMYTQVWCSVIVTETLLLVMATDWVQLPMVEPGGRIQFKPRPRENENDFQIQTSEAKKTDEIQMKAETMNPINKFPPAQTSDIFNDQFTTKITKYTGNDQSDTQAHNSEPNLNKDDLVITPVPKSHNSKLTIYDSVENNYGAQMPEKVTFIQPSHQMPFKSDLEGKESNTQIPQFKELTTVNLHTPNLPPRPNLEVTTIEADVKLPNPATLKHHSYIKDSSSKFSNTLSETNTTPYPAEKADNEYPEGIITSTEPDVSSTDKEPEASWKHETSNSNNKNEENIPQDVNSPLNMLREVHRKLIQETPHSVRGKMHFLQQLKNKMLCFIEGHIKALWTSDHERQARTEKGMAFPSMEGALMSISFLIFAVFLIKLVQQMIQNLQGTNMAMTTGRHSHSLPDLLTTARVLRLVDEFPFKYEDNGWSDRQHVSSSSGQ